MRKIQKRVVDKLATLRQSVREIFSQSSDVETIITQIDTIATELQASEMSESEIRFRSIFEHTTLGMALVGLDNRFLQVNPSLCEMFGYSESEFLAKSFFDLTPPEESSRICLDQLLAGETQQIRLEKRFIHKQGHTLWTLVNCFLIYDAENEPQFFMVQWQDITQQKRVQEAYHILAEHSLQGLMIIQGAEVSFVNTALANILGYSIDELLKLTIFDLYSLIHPEDRPMIKQYWQGRLTPEFVPHNCEMRVTCKKGEIRWLEQFMIPINYRGQPAIQSTFLDITERKQAEMSLQKLSMAVEQAADLVIITNKEGQIEYVNSAFEQLTGYYKKEVEGKTPRILKSGKHDQAYYKTIWRTLLSGQVYRGTVINRKKDGTLYHEEKTITPIKNPQGQITHFISTGKDITKRKMAEAALQESESRYRTLFDNASDAIFVSDLEGYLIDVNQIACERLGYNRQELLQMSFVEIATCRCKALTNQQFQDIYQQKHIVFETSYICRDGSLIPMEISARVIRYRGQEAILSFARDITERKRAEAALRQSEERYRQMFEKNHAVKLIIDPNTGNIVDANLGAASFYGYSVEKLKQMKIMDINILSQEEVAREMNRARREQRVHFIFQHKLASGEIRDVEVHSGPVNIRGRCLLYSIITDITERKRAEEALRRYAEHLRALHDIDQAILNAQSSQTIAQVALSYIQHLIPSIYRASVAEFDLKANKAKILADRVGSDSKVGKGATFSAEVLGVELLRQGQIYIVEDISALASPLPMHKILLAEGVRSYIAIPLIAQGKMIGSLNLASDTSGVFLPDHVNIARQVATSLALAIQQARLYEQTQHDAQTKAVLLNEVNHRVKNNLATIIGLLYAERNHAKEGDLVTYQAIMQDLISRVQGLATVHGLLSDSEWKPVSLSELLEQVVHTALLSLPSDKHVVIRVSPSPIKVNPKQASSLAIIANELTTNTIKYALIGREIGHINVEIENSKNQVSIIFQDDGPGYSEEVLRLKHYSVGLYLIKTIVQRDLHGTLTLKNKRGTVTIIRFKVVG